jgi:hypothetical protein
LQIIRLVERSQEIEWNELSFQLQN